MDIRFDKKVALVTGAGSGIGAQIARDLAGAGAKVVVADWHLPAAEAIETEIVAAGGTAFALACDVSDPKAVEAMMAAAEEKYGPIDLLVNNAGIGGPQAPVGEYPVDGWQQVIDINLNGVFYGMRFAIPQMVKNGGGAIVNVASILGSVGFANSSAYTAAKHGVVGLTKAAALEHAAAGIRVNAVGPGFISTPLLEALPADALAGIASLHAAKRLGTVSEVSALVQFLLSDQASFITGSYHLVDGGYTAQ
ncbi:SDR family NAD(P)-dependent oxidoreductase [Phaeovulum sp.]|uniref:SDR family NAD(P)-dependent oxidoreductase n=1 Tax=Phaeovulum sp. TaxID=2934796 RepID=UPI00356289F5